MEAGSVLALVRIHGGCCLGIACLTRLKADEIRISEACANRWQCPPAGFGAAAEQSNPRGRRYGHGFWSSLWAVLSAVVLDFLLVGFTIATAGWRVPPWLGPHCRPSIGGW